MENRVEARDFCLTRDRTLKPNNEQFCNNSVYIKQLKLFGVLSHQMDGACLERWYVRGPGLYSVIQIKLLLSVFSSSGIHCVPLVSLSCDMPTREDGTALWDYSRPSTIPQISIRSLCIITQPLTSQFYTFNFTVTLLASQDVSSLSNSKISKKVQTLYLIFKNTHDLNPIYF